MVMCNVHFEVQGVPMRRLSLELLARNGLFVEDGSTLRLHVRGGVLGGGTVLTCLSRGGSTVRTFSCH